MKNRKLAEEEKVAKDRYDPGKWPDGAVTKAPSVDSCLCDRLNFPGLSGYRLRRGSSRKINFIGQEAQAKTIEPKIQKKLSSVTAVKVIITEIDREGSGTSHPKIKKHDKPCRKAAPKGRLFRCPTGPYVTSRS